MDGELPTRSRDRIAGILLVAASVLIVFTMGHHPSGAHAARALGAIVHGTMIVLVAITGCCLAYFAKRRGLARLSVLFGLVAYSISAFANLVAASINGFIAPAVAAHGDELEAAHDLLVLCWEANQAMARLAVFAAGAAFCVWSIDMLVRRTRGMRTIGVIGVIAGVVPALTLLGGRAMDVPTAFAIYSTHASWCVLVGVQLFRGKLSES